ncbi:MAG: amidase family protein [Pseudomonadota bacterium]
MSDIFTMTAASLGRAIAAGELDPVDLTTAFLDRIDGHELTSKTYARVTPDRAMAEAEAARDRAKAGHRLSLLDGVPISWKDLFDTAGTGTEAGSKLLAGRVPTRDAEVVRNASAAGLVCLGKVHMSELAFSGLGHNPSTATPPCVNDADAVAGGSSSGSAASVAFGLAAASIGSDTGGSVRIPSAWNDLVGLKTTLGLLSVEGTVPLCPSFDTVGPLARSVEDAALLTAILAGATAPDLAGATLKGRRFAVLKTSVLDDIRDAPKDAFDNAVARLQDAGASVAPIDIPEVVDALALSGALFPTEAYGVWKETIEANPDAMYDQIRERFRLGASVSAPDYVAAWKTLDALRAAWHTAAAPFDAVLAPTSPILPPDLARLNSDPDYYVTENLMALRNTRVGNLMGLSALTLPTGVPSCGIMLLGRPNGEAALLRLGAAAEAALG